MSSDRRTARTAGVLFILATAASLLSLPFLGPINDSNYLVSFSANANGVLTGALLATIAAFASASIAISLYPVLSRSHRSLALGAVGFRLIEGVFYIVGVAALVVLFTLSQQFVSAGAPSASYYQTLGALLLSGYHWVSNVGALLAFGLGALSYYYIFYRTRLVPRWLSGWGLVAIVMTMVSAVLVMYSLVGPLSTFQVVLNLPIAVQEMVLAVWLLIKGFNSPAIASSTLQ